MHFRKARGCVDRTFTLRLKNHQRLSHQTSLVLSFLDYEQVPDTVDRRA